MEEDHISFYSNSVMVNGVEDYAHQIAEMIGLRSESDFNGAGVSDLALLDLTFETLRKNSEYWVIHDFGLCFVSLFLYNGCFVSCSWLILFRVFCSLIINKLITSMDTSILENKKK